VEYEEKEDEFDIVSICVPFAAIHSDFTMQEDESEISKRKMKAEEEEVDVEGVDLATLPLPQRGLAHDSNGVHDDDIAWADEEADGDVVGWKMKLIMEDDTI
jgi:COMPASS component SWD1